jgi:hypothetical protein
MDIFLVDIDFVIFKHLNEISYAFSVSIIARLFKNVNKLQEKGKPDGVHFFPEHFPSPEGLLPFRFCCLFHNH